jgi:hypothetical protein
MLPLTKSLPVYIFDTAFVTRIDRTADPDAVWDRVMRLIEDGRLVTLPQVMDALDKSDRASYARLAPFSARIVLPIDRQKVMEADRISESYAGMPNPYHPVNGSDPWLIASAKIGGFIVLTGEADDREAMTSVCQREGVACIDVDALMNCEATDRP